MDWRPAVQVVDRGSEQWRPKDLICRERKNTVRLTDKPWLKVLFADLL
jgi:hypothetical protein